MSAKNDEFYIGYMPTAPAGIARFVWIAVVALVLLASGVAAIVAATQRTVGPSNFEFGVVRDFAGTVVLKPYPVLHVTRPGPVYLPRRYSRYLLVAPGKFGADELVEGFTDRPVELKGTLIFRDGQTMIEVIPGTVKPLEAGREQNHDHVHGAPTPVPSGPGLSLGTQTLRGEIVDSKCYYGVMNPGDLKSHKSCAMRCIKGGIPPVLVIRRPEGAKYYMLTSPTGQAVNQQVLEFVAEPVEVTGEVVRHGDLWVLKTDPATIKVIGTR